MRDGKIKQEAFEGGHLTCASCFLCYNVVVSFNLAFQECMNECKS